MKRCPNCLSEYGDGATYCEKCGTKLIKPSYCPSCGEEIRDDSILYCSKCGQNLNGENSQSEIKNVDEQLIEQYKRELIYYKNKKSSFKITGLILLFSGIAAITLLIILLATLYTPSFVPIFVFGTILAAFLIDAGITLLIIQAAVFNRKISNREKIINK